MHSMYGSEVRALRLERGWTQAELAKRAGISQASVSRIERGELQTPYAVKRTLGIGGSPPSEPWGKALYPAMAWRPPPERLRPHVHTQQWQRPDSSGDAFVTVTLPREGFVAVALDVAGHGAEQVPKVTYLEGWLRGWTHGLSVIPRIESFAEDLNAELRRAELDAAWFAAIVSFQ